MEADQAHMELDDTTAVSHNQQQPTHDTTAVSPKHKQTKRVLSCKMTPLKHDTSVMSSKHNPHKHNTTEASPRQLNSDMLRELRRFKEDHQRLANTSRRRRTREMQKQHKEYLTHLNKLAFNLNKGHVNLTDKEFQGLKKRRKHLLELGSVKLRPALSYCKTPKGASLCHQLASLAQEWLGSEK